MTLQRDHFSDDFFSSLLGMRYVILVVVCAIASNAHACKCPQPLPWYNATDRARATLIEFGQLSPSDRVTLQHARVIAVNKDRAKVDVLELFRGTPINELQFIPPDGYSCSLNLKRGEDVLLAIREMSAISCLSLPGVDESIVQEIRRLKDEPVESLWQQQKQRRHEWNKEWERELQRRHELRTKREQSK